MTRIQQIRVDGFGPLYDAKVVLPRQGVVVLYGPNETGKTSLHEFIGQMLFGSLLRTGIDSRYKPVRGGRQGGEMIVEHGDQTFEIIRRFDDAVARRLQVRGDTIDLTGSDAEHWLTNTLQPVDRSVFRRVFSITLDPTTYGEVRPFDDNESTVLDRLAISATLGGAADISQRLNDLASSIDSLYTPKGRTKRLNELLAEYEDQKRVLRDAVRDAAASVDLSTTADKMRAEAGALRTEQLKIDRLLKSMQVDGQLRQLQVEIDLLQAQRDQSIELVERTQIEAWRTSLNDYAEAESKLRDVRDALELSQKTVVPEPLDEVTIKEIRKLVPEISAIRQETQQHQQLSEALQPSVASDSVPLAELSDVEVAQLDAQIDLYTRQLDQLDARRHVESTMPQPPVADTTTMTPSGWLGVVTSVAAALAVVLAEPPALRVAALALGVVGVVVAMRGRRSLRSNTADDSNDRSPLQAEQRVLSREIDQVLQTYFDNSLRQDQLDHAAQLSGLKSMLAQSRQHLETHKETQLRQLQLDQLTQRLQGVDRALDSLRQQLPELAADRLSALGQLPQILEVQQRSQESRTVAQQQQQELNIRVEQLNRRLNDATVGIQFILQSADNAASRQALLSRMDEQREIGQQLQQLKVRYAATLDERGDSGQQPDGSLDQISLEMDASGLQLRHGQLQDEINQLHGEIGALTEKHRAMLSSTAVSDAELQRQALATEILQTFGDLLARRLAQTVINQQLGIHERQNQPAVFRRASQWFSEVTEGRYQEVLVREGHVIVIDRNGLEIASLDALSRGTIEQLYVLLRFALADEISAQSNGLPFVLDEILINFDDARRQAFYPVLADIATRHQVLYFTCHEWMRNELTAHTQAEVVQLNA